MNINLVVCCDRQKDDKAVLIQPVEGTNEVPRVLAIIKRTTAPEILADYDAYFLLIEPNGDAAADGVPLLVSGTKLSFDSLDFIR